MMDDIAADSVPTGPTSLEVAGETAVACGFLVVAGFAAYHTVRDCGWSQELHGYAKASMNARVWLALLMACGSACRAATFSLSAFDKLDQPGKD